MVYCVKMSILESSLYNFLIIIILFLLCAVLVWSLNCSVLSSVPYTVCRTLSPVLISDFASALLENFNYKVGVITSLLTLSQAFDNYVHFNKRYSSKSLKDTEN